MCCAVVQASLIADNIAFKHWKFDPQWNYGWLIINYVVKIFTVPNLANIVSAGTALLLGPQPHGNIQADFRDQNMEQHSQLRIGLCLGLKCHWFIFYDSKFPNSACIHECWISSQLNKLDFWAIIRYGRKVSVDHKHRYHNLQLYKNRKRQQLLICIGP